MNKKTEKFIAQTAGRLDQIIQQEINPPSRNFVINLIKDGCVTVNQIVARKSGTTIKSGDQIQINWPTTQRASLKPLNQPLDIIFENQDYLVINKPPFLPVHPSYGHLDDTLINILAFHYPDFKKFGHINQTLRPGIVHRLDMNTSGLIVIAKNQNTLNQFQQDIKDKKWHKSYLAWVLNNSQRSRGVLKKNLVRSPHDRKKFTVTATDQGKTAITRYQIINSIKYEKNTLSQVKISIETGRTHQIRVHLLNENLPILGDEIYHTKDSKLISKQLKINRQLLHAAELTILDPHFHQPLSYTAPAPADFNIKRDNF